MKRVAGGTRFGGGESDVGGFKRQWRRGQRGKVCSRRAQDKRLHLV